MTSSDLADWMKLSDMEDNVKRQRLDRVIESINDQYADLDDLIDKNECVALWVYLTDCSF